jgi:uncharacterized protein (DUF169 family)/NAD-dependent dihydropyrimidine dehydrogenase PreA subunit
MLIPHPMKSMTQEDISMRIKIDKTRCNGCGNCAGFCPMSVFDMSEINGTKLAQAARSQDCCACYVCVGQCPAQAIKITQTLPAKRYLDKPGENPYNILNKQEKKKCADLSKSLEEILKLRWKPVAVTLVPRGGALPHVAVPQVKLRYCQSLAIARRGKSLLMLPQSHACPDGASILGLMEIPPKLAAGNIYVKFGKVASQEAAQRLVSERPSLPALSIGATLVTPLEDAIVQPDVVVIIATPESMMWLSMASTFETGRRLTFQMGSYNALCLEATLYPYTTGEINASLGCYGCRSITDFSDDLMFMGIPEVKLASLVESLQYLGKKAIPESRSKIYLPPQV